MTVAFADTHIAFYAFDKYMEKATTAEAIMDKAPVMQHRQVINGRLKLINAFYRYIRRNSDIPRIARLRWELIIRRNKLRYSTK